MAHLWAKWLRQPCRLGDPHRCRAGGGGNQKWPTSGQSGYLTPAVSGIPTAVERGSKSEVAHKWAKWLRHPCRLGDPHRCRAGGKIRSGPLVGKVATSPVRSRGSPPLHSGRKSEVAHLWAKWLRQPCRLGDPHRCRAGGGGSEVAHKWAEWLPHPCRLGDPHRCVAGVKIRGGPQVGKVATSPLPSRGSPPLHSGGKSEVPHKWAKWLCHPCRLGDPHRFRAWGKIRSGPLVYVIPALLGIPSASKRGGSQKWPTCGQNGYVALAVLGIPTASERGAKSEVAHLWGKWLCHPCRLGDRHRFRAGGKSEVAHKWAKWLCHPCRLGDPHRFRAGGKSEVAHKWAKWLRHPCRLGDPHRCRAGGKIRSGPLVGKVAMSPLPSRGSPPLQSRGEIRSGPQVGKLATSPLPSRGSPPLQSGGQNQKWPTCGESGYVTPAVSGIATASEQGGNQKWPTSGQSGYVTLPSRGSPPLHIREEIRSGTLVGKVGTSPLPSRESPPLESGGGGGDQKWATSGQSGYLTPAVSGIPIAAERGAKSEVAHKWANWLRHPCRLGDPHRCRAGGGKSEVAHLWAKWLYHPCRLGDPHRCKRGGNQKWPTSGQSGYVTPAVSGIPTALQRGAKSEVAHLWAKWLRYACRLGDAHRFRAGGGLEVVHKWANWLRHLCHLGDPHRCRAGEGRESELAQLWGKWLRHPCLLGDPHRLRAGRKSEVAHLWAKWLQHPYRLGRPHRFRAGEEIRSGTQVGKVATSPLPSRGSPPLESKGESEVAHLWAKWLCHPCRLGDPHRCRAGGGEIRSGPLVGKVAMSPLPSRGFPPLQSGGGK